MAEMKATVIHGAEVYAPEPLGKREILLVDGKFAQISAQVDRAAVKKLKIPYQEIDATGCIVTPGLIDPHVHLLGSSGEEGFATQTPPIFLEEIIRAGLTSVVGTLGVNTSTSNMFSLYAKARALKEDGISAYVYTGGYDVPPMCLTNSLRNDLLYIDEVIGVGEIAISDKRSIQPEARELARVVADAYVGGILAKKAGIAHFHVGEGKEGLQLLRDLIRDFEITPESLYPTHIERSPKLMREAIALARKGASVDIDTVEGDLHKWLSYYLRHGGPPKRLTVSSDCHNRGPEERLQQLRDCVLRHRFALETILPFYTTNVARILKLGGKGELKMGNDADLLILGAKDLDLRYVIAQDQVMMEDGEVVKKPKYVEMSDRRATLAGEKKPDKTHEEIRAPDKKKKRGQRRGKKR